MFPMSRTIRCSTRWQNSSNSCPSVSVRLKCPLLKNSSVAKTALQVWLDKVRFRLRSVWSALLTCSDVTLRLIPVILIIVLVSFRLFGYQVSACNEVLHNQDICTSL